MQRKRIVFLLFLTCSLMACSGNDPDNKTTASPGTEGSAYDIARSSQKANRVKESTSPLKQASKTASVPQKSKSSPPKELESPLNYDCIVEVADDDLQLGHSIALKSNLLLAGVRNGAIVYKREPSIDDPLQNVWHEVASLMPTRFHPMSYRQPTGLMRDWYVPRCVAIGDNIALISDHESAPPRNDYPAMKAGGNGAVYVFELQGTNWKHVTTLIPPEPKTHTSFGAAIAITTDHILVGAPGYNDRQGAVFVFNRTGYELDTMLTPKIGTDHTKFGEDIAAYKDRALIGAPGTNVSLKEGKGAAYLIHKQGNQWNSTIILPQKDFAPDQFGTSVALYDNWALIGDPGAYMPKGRTDLDTPGNAVLYMLDKDDVTFVTELKTPMGSKFSGKEFGKCVALSSNMAVIIENYYGGNDMWHVFSFENSKLIPLESTILKVPLKNNMIAIEDEFVFYGFPNMFVQSTTYLSRKRKASIFEGHRIDP